MVRINSTKRITREDWKTTVQKMEQIIEDIMKHLDENDFDPEGTYEKSERLSKTLFLLREVYDKIYDTYRGD